MTWQHREPPRGKPGGLPAPGAWPGPTTRAAARTLAAFLVLAVLGAAASRGAEIWPRRIVLRGPAARHAILSPAPLESEDPGIARVEGSQIVAVADGSTAIRTAGERVEVVVRDTSEPPWVDFAGVILPTLTRHGCNQADCHGAALGQGGFKLSLFGNDPHRDYLAITRELAGRRVDLATPEQSLILLKPTRTLAHEGGRRFSRGGATYRTLLSWGRRGFPEADRSMQLEELELHGEKQLVVRAWYRNAEGRVARDVTHLARFDSNDDAVAEVSAAGAVTLKGAGETSIMVRFGGRVSARRVGRPYGKPIEVESLPHRTSIDRFVNAGLARLGLAGGGICDDATFLRRVFLDLTGSLPTAARARSFLADPDRDALVESLIASEDFEAYWGYRLDQLFGLDSARMGAEGARAFHDWLRARVRLPWSETAREIITASGRSPPASFYRRGESPRELSENVGRIFLGARWMCGQCHDHPFAHFLRDDYWGLAAFFARIRRTEAGVEPIDRGDIDNPRTGRPARPAFPGGDPLVDAGADRRVALASWIVQQPQFHRALANRVWAWMMGRGLVHPVDDFRASNPPSHPGLLAELARRRTIPDLVRAITRSAAYQRVPARPGELRDLRAFSHAPVRPLPAEVLVDAVARATGIEAAFPGREAPTRAIDLGDLSVPSYTLDVCGRGREGFAGSLARRLHLLNGDFVEERLAGVEPLLLFEDPYLVEELYLRTVTRLPRPEEREHWEEWLAARSSTREERREAARDLLWALLNSREFTTCH